MSLLFEALNLRKDYGELTALFLPAFQLEYGGAIIVTGPNGSGKSTLLRLLAFLEQPTSGSLRFFGDSKFPRREVTLLLQEPWLLRSSVFANVTLGLRLRGQKGPFDQQFDIAMRQAGFSEPEKFARRRPPQLSGGEKQRIALAARLILKPQALLLDEPTSSVDVVSQKCIVNALKIFQKNGGAIVCSTHDQELLAALSAANLRLEPVASAKS